MYRIVKDPSLHRVSKNAYFYADSKFVEMDSKNGQKKVTGKKQKKTVQNLKNFKLA
jgi:hypothetical protein